MTVWNRIFEALFGWRKRFGRMDFAVLKTMMLLAAVDGDISVDELAQFRKKAGECRGFDVQNFATVWATAEDAAEEIRRLVGKVPEAELVNAFVRAASPDFVDEVVQEKAEERDHAFAALEEMAESDDDRSGIEQKCLTALARHVRRTRESMMSARYVSPGMRAS